MGRYMSKEEKAAMKADLEKRQAASRRKSATNAAKAPNQVKAKGWQRMTDAEKAAARKETGRDKTLTAARAAGDKYRRDRAAKNKESSKPTPKNTARPGGDKGYKETGRGNAAASSSKTAASDAKVAELTAKRRAQKRNFEQEVFNAAQKANRGQTGEQIQRGRRKAFETEVGRAALRARGDK